MRMRSTWLERDAVPDTPGSAMNTDGSLIGATGQTPARGAAWSLFPSLRPCVGALPKAKGKLAGFPNPDQLALLQCPSFSQITILCGRGGQLGEREREEVCVCVCVFANQEEQG